MRTFDAVSTLRNLTPGQEETGVDGQLCIYPSKRFGIR